MKSTDLHKNFYAIVLGFFLLILVALIFMATFEVEQSARVVVWVDEREQEKLLVNSNVAYKIQDEAFVVLRHDGEYKKVPILLMEHLENDVFALDVEIPGKKLLLGSRIDAWIIYEYRSLLSMIVRF